MNIVVENPGWVFLHVYIYHDSNALRKVWNPTSLPPAISK